MCKTCFRLPIRWYQILITRVIGHYETADTGAGNMTQVLRKNSISLFITAELSFFSAKF